MTYLYILSEDVRGLPFEKAAELLWMKTSHRPEDTHTVVKVKTIDELNRALCLYADIIELTYIGHGNFENLFLGVLPGHRTNLSKDGADKIYPKDGRILKTSPINMLYRGNIRPDAVIRLYSCFSACEAVQWVPPRRFGECIAVTFARYFKVKVYGAISGVKFDQDGLPYSVTKLACFNRGAFPIFPRHLRFSFLYTVLCTKTLSFLRSFLMKFMKETGHDAVVRELRARAEQIQRNRITDVGQVTPKIR